MMSTSNSMQMTGVYTVAVCAGTGNQGYEICKRFHELNEKNAAAGNLCEYHVRALTRADGKGKANKKIVKKFESLKPTVQVWPVHWDSPMNVSIHSAFNGVDAVYVNFALTADKPQQTTKLLDAASTTISVKHIVCASIVGCDANTDIPHYDWCFDDEEYLKRANLRREKLGHGGFTCHFLRAASLNEFVQKGSLYPPKNGMIQFPYESDKGVYMTSARDVARAAVKLFDQPSCWPHGTHIDVATEFLCPNEIAQTLTQVSGVQMKAEKGPWMFLKMGNMLTGASKSMYVMGQYVETKYSQKCANLTHMEKLLGEQELRREPLETFEAFALKKYSSDSSIKSAWYKICA